MRLLTLALISCCALTPVLGQDAPSTETKKPTPLFRSQEPLSLTITADFKELFKDRDTTKTTWVPATLGWTEGGTASQMAIELTTRGHFRLKPSTCSFPPIRVRFNKDSVDKTVWDKQSTIKLVTHCKPNYEQLVLQEYLVYRTHNLLTDLSLQARLARIEYRDTQKPDLVEAFWGFFLEDEDDMAKRNNGKLFKEQGVGFEVGDPTLTGMMSVFFYMAGNTDWSMPYQHNVIIVERGFEFLPVPYDFDWSGIVGAPYAKPDYRLPIKSVRERLYRGPCIDRDALTSILDKFRVAKESITTLYQSLEGMEPKRRDEALKYLGDFWKVIDDPKSTDRELRQVCQR